MHHRRVGASALLVSAAVAGLSAPAAESRVVSTIAKSSTSPVGPAIAGPRVVWAERRGEGWQVRSATSPRTRRVVARLDDRVMAVAASGTHVAVATDEEVLAGPLRGPLRLVDPTGPGAASLTEDGSREPSAPPADPGCGSGAIDPFAGVALAGSRLVVADAIPRCDGQGAVRRVVERDLASGAAPQVVAASGGRFVRLHASGAATGWTLITSAPASEPSIGGSSATRSVDAAGRTLAYVSSSGSRYAGPFDATAMRSDGTLAVSAKVEDSADTASFIIVQRPGAAEEEVLTYPADDAAAYDHLALRGSILVARADDLAPRVTRLGGASRRLSVRGTAATSGVDTNGRRIAWFQSTGRGVRVRLDSVPSG